MASTLNEVPEIHYEYTSAPKNKSAKPVTAQSGYPVPNTARYRRLMDLQSKLSANDGKLVWQKLPKDMPLYYLSVGLVVAGVILTFSTLKKLATPPKND